MKVILIQPPLVQLNAPYPSGAYLSAFFKECGCEVRWLDLSIRLFYEIFSKTGLERLFELSEKRALKMAAEAEKNGDEGSAFNLLRYVSTKDLWCGWIDVITGILRGEMREKEHEFLFSPYAPRGSRMEAFLAGLNREPSVDDVRFLASYALADLADYITSVFDRNFSLIRYAESLTVDESSFSEIEKELDSPVLKEFYLPLLEKIDFLNYFSSGKAGSADFEPRLSEEKILIGISVPFAGTFVPSLFTARYLKKLFGKRAYIVLGGGFVNTELRESKDIGLSKYIDGLSFDRGYGAFYELLKAFKKEGSFFKGKNAAFTEGALSGNASVPEGSHAGGRLSNFQKLYKFRFFLPESVIEPDWKGSEEIVKKENDFTRSLVPDFSDIDFSIYPRLCDDKNPMQRLWSDGSWIKAYLAHGCYWHRCAFCDTQLDYVCGFMQADVEKLYKGLFETAQKKGVYGLHFVDEALPPAALKKFALLNAACRELPSAGEKSSDGLAKTWPSESTAVPLSGSSVLPKNAPVPPAAPRLYFWGNVRFEKAFTYDLAALLSYGGLGGVSAGLEVATGDGLKSINKGTDIDSIVSACAAFKENGILVHAYMIYGFWNDTPQNIINSMETLRQLFAEGLLDSAFWHKFMLTKNSQVMKEWERGLHKELKPIFPKKNSMFTGNALHFEGENRFKKFGPVLDKALTFWMQGKKLDLPVRKWFDFDVPSPAISKDFIEKAIGRYEKQKSEPVKEIFKRELYWLGSKPVLIENKNNKALLCCWFYMQEMFEEIISDELYSLLWALRPEEKLSLNILAKDKIKKSERLQEEIQRLRGRGLVIL